MPRRGVSPARSENEVDIAASLFTNHDREDDASNDEEIPADENGGSLVQHEDLDVMADDSADGDESIIAKQLHIANRKGTNLKGRTVKKGGGFQAMGLNANLLKAITRKGFSVPTPIQRKTIPLLLNEKDVVGMARTGSGKTAAFVIPMIEKLKAHSPKVGSRALILSPSRELALQTMSVVKELGRGTDLRSILLVGGDSLEEQFSSMASNPDIIIATPGRFLHLKVEMQLDLSSVRYVVFDEADRLFEMGFAAQLTEIVHALPSSRQTLLFSATLPKSLVEFARAGLQEPNLVRLDADSKISPDLQSAFFSVKSSEKEGALLHLLEDVIRAPTGSQLVSTVTETNGKKPSKKRKRQGTEGNPQQASDPHSTIVFAATKHHVEYLAQLLQAAGYAVSYVYGSLDQTARKAQVQSFRDGQSNILVVTDVAARGIDIPILANVINYDFPSQPKIYIHRVGRTARAGQKGWSYSLVRDADAPYLLDLQLFLGRKLVVGRDSGTNPNLATDVVVGSQRRDAVQTHSEWVTRTLETSIDLAALRVVASKGEKLYLRTRNSASSESAKRAKSIVGSDAWSELHAMFGGDDDDMEAKRQAMLARVGGFRPQESIFEIGARRTGRKGHEEAVDAIRTIRTGLERKKQKSLTAQKNTVVDEGGNNEDEFSDDENEHPNGGLDDMSLASDSELEVTFTNAPSSSMKSKKQKQDLEKTADNFRSSEFFMSYAPTSVDLEEEKAYGVHSGSNSTFVEAARGATMDLAGDEGSKGFGEARGVMRWDKRHKKYVSRSNDEDGSKGKKLVRGESGAKIAASFRSGRFDAWKKANKVRGLRVGEKEKEGGGAQGGGAGVSGKRFKHSKVQKPKAADKYRDDYEKQKKKFDAAKEREVGQKGDRRELHSVDDIRKARNLKQKRQEKNARPSRKGRK